MYAIYIKHKPKDEPLEAVLLTDGCFTSETNCYIREFGYVWHKPLLFPLRGGAKNHAYKYGFTGKRYRIRKYAGPTEPWERA